MTSPEPSHYYSYDATVALREHLALAGYCSEDTRAVGHRLAALSGLPLLDLDRKIEHRAGKSVWELIWTEGTGRYRQLENEALARAMDETPRGILVLGDGALIDEANQRRIASSASLTLLDLDLPNLYWRLQKQRRNTDSPWHPLFARPLGSLEDLRPFFEERRPGFAGADLRISVRGRHPNVIASLLLRQIEALSAAS